MKFGIITPVFDGCLESLELVSRDIFQQTHTDWVWALCSNGHSKKISRFAREKNKLLNKELSGTDRLLSVIHPKILNLHTRYEDLPDAVAILANVGKRRNYCIQRLRSDYTFMIDADAKLLDKDMFRIIEDELEKSPKDLCIYKVIHDKGMLPIFPISYGGIDMLNYCVKSSLAKKIGYPTTVNPVQRGNDYWFFNRIYMETKGEYLFIDRVFGQHNGNNTYMNLLKQF